jgi:hypothetical protein
MVLVDPRPWPRKPRTIDHAFKEDIIKNKAPGPTPQILGCPDPSPIKIALNFRC